MIYIIVFMVAFVLGYLLCGVLAGNSMSALGEDICKKRKRIEEQTTLIFELRKQLVEAKGAASSNEFRADALQKMKDELQEYYDELAKDYKEFVTDYKKLYVELDALKASEVRKFRTPEEIEALLKNDIDYDGILNVLSTIEEMLLEAKDLKVKLAV